MDEWATRPEMIWRRGAGGFVLCARTPMRADILASICCLTIAFSEAIDGMSCEPEIVAS